MSQEVYTIVLMSGDSASDKVILGDMTLDQARQLELHLDSIFDLLCPEYKGPPYQWDLAFPEWFRPIAMIWEGGDLSAQDDEGRDQFYWANDDWEPIPTEWR
jgi:hypothetical protein